MLAPSEIEFYFIQGYLVLRGFLDESRIALLRDLTNAELRRTSDPAARLQCDPAQSIEAPHPGAVTRLPGLMARHEAFRVVALDGRIAEAARIFVGPHPAVCVNRHNTMVVKAPRSDAAIHWHQDGATWGHPRMLTAMVFLDQAARDSGCISIVPGMHRAGLFSVAPESSRMDLDDPRQAAMVRQSLCVCVSPGDALLLHSCMPHCSHANHSGHSRRYLTFAYFDEGDKPSGSENLEPIESIRVA